MFRISKNLLFYLLIGLVLLTSTNVLAAAPSSTVNPWTIYMPIVQTGQSSSLPDAPRIAIPFINVAPDLMNDHTGELSVFWFGEVRNAENYTDVRMGYNSQELFIRLHVFDRRCWFDETEPLNEPTKWDAAAVYLNLDGNTGNVPTSRSYQFLVQFDAFPTWNPEWEITKFPYQGNGTGWTLTNLPFNFTSSYTGGVPNDDGDDRGWTAIIRVPFSSLGLSSAPAQGTIWGLAVVNYDRDDAAGTPIAPKVWPRSVNLNQPSSWGQFVFGLPAASPAPNNATGSVTISQGLNGATVSDASVGGSSQCGAGTSFFGNWGDTNEIFYNPVLSDFNIQNQGNVADWPCFSKVYIAFPLNQVPAGKRILSATLTMYVFGNSGIAGQEHASLIHVYSLNQTWNESTITWNNAPYVDKYITQTWVNAPPANTGFPGIPNSWDVTAAVTAAYAAGKPVNLVLYSSDNWMDSGKYFISSNTGDWNAAGRPKLTIVWGD